MNAREINISGINLKLLTASEIVGIVDYALKTKNKTIVSYCDFRILNYLRKEKLSFYDSNTTIAYPDSFGLYIILKILFRKSVRHFRKLVSTDINNMIMDKCNNNSANIFLLGSTVNVIEKFIDKTNREHDKINVVGFSNGYEYNDNEIISEINKNNVNILFVGMGVPKQEIWINQNYFRLNVNVIVSVGAFFSYYSGAQKRAPSFIRVIHLEWLYRFINEPKRLWRRYFVEFPKLLLTLLLSEIKK